MSYTYKKNAAESKAKKRLAIVLLVCAVLGLGIYLVAPPPLDENFCPIDKSKIKPHKLSMLIDITSQLSNQNKKIVNNLIADWISGNVSSQKLSIYSLNTSNMNDFEDVDTICSPPNAMLLGFSYGRQKANQRIEEFKKRIQDKVDAASSSRSQLNNSRILEAIRQITNGPSWFPGSSRLILISDLIEKSDFADFYNSSAPAFDGWIGVKGNLGLVNSIQISRGDRIQICQVLTERPGYDSREKAKQFWVDLFAYKGVSEVFFTCNGIVKD